MPILKALIIRNLTVFYRSWMKFIVELIVVLGVFIVIVHDPFNVPVLYTPKINYRTAPASKVDTLERHQGAENVLGYYPENAQTSAIVNSVAGTLGLTALAFKSKAEMIKKFKSSNLYAGIEFVDVKRIIKQLYANIMFPAEFRNTKKDTKDPHNDYWVLRMNGMVSKDNLDRGEVKPDLYITEGFIQIQQLMFATWFDTVLLKKTNDDMKYQPTTENYFIKPYEYIKCSRPKDSLLYDWILYVCFFPSFCFMCWRFGREMQENLPFHHWKVGCKNGFYWLVNYVMHLLYFFIFDIVILLIIKIQWSKNLDTFKEAKYIDLLSFFILYNSALIALAMLLALIMQDGKNTVLVGAIWWIVNCCVFAFYIYFDREEPSGFIWPALIIFPNNHISLSFHYLKYHTIDRHDYFLFLMALNGNILLTTILFTVIKPSRPGRYLKYAGGKKVYCPCLKSKDEDQQLLTAGPARAWERFEFGPPGKKEAAKFRNVTTYRDLKDNDVLPILKNITMRLYADEITVFVGSQQSGKTTLVRVLSGWQSPDVGIVEYFGSDIKKEWKSVSLLSDVLFPNNPLVDLLTVAECISYIVRLKAGKRDRDFMRKEREKWESYLEVFIPDDSVLIKKLGFEKQRLLSLCCVLACDQKIVVMDEPTANLSFRNQRIFWEICRNEKTSRAIVFTSRSYVEAEAVGDRIGLLENGVLMAMGSPFFLKTTFGVYDHLIIYKKPSADTEKITNFIQDFIPNTKPDNDMEEQVIYKTPYEDRDEYQKLLIGLEKNSHELQITKAKILAPNIKNVYQALSIEQNPLQYHPSIFGKRCTEEALPYVTKKKLCCNHMRAIAIKKLLGTQPYLLSFFMFILTIALSLYITYMYSHVSPVNSNEEISSVPVLFKSKTRPIEKYKKYKDCDYILIKRNEYSETDYICGYGQFSDLLERRERIKSIYGAIDSYNNEHTLWYSVEHFHSVAHVCNAYNLLVLSVAQDKHAMASFGNKPVGEVPDEALLAYKSYEDHLTHFIMPIVVGILIPIFTSYFIMEIVQDRNSKCFLIYEACGMSWDAYWFITFLFDFCIYCACMICIELALCCISTYEYTGLDKLFGFFLLCIHGSSVLPMIYFLSTFKYYSPLRAYLITLIVQLLTGLALHLFYIIILEEPLYIYYAALLFPTFALIDSFYQFSVCYHVPECGFFELLSISEPSFMIPIMYMMGTSILWIFGVYLITDYKKAAMYRTPKTIREYRSLVDLNGDPQVIAIRQEIASYSKADCLKHFVTVDQLENQLQNHRRIHTVSFTLEPHNILCIRGPKFSGKSRMSKQLVGLENYQFGEVYINGKDLKLDTEACQSIIGYGPQNLECHPELTMRNILAMYFLMKGVKQNAISERINHLIYLFNANRFCNRYYKNLTYAQQRKVNIALVVAANNKLLVFDEPTAGLTPNSSREIWMLLRYLRFCGKSIIVFTNDAMECETLGGHTMIVDNYRMLAYNSVFSLMTTYTKFLLLEIKLLLDGSNKEEVEENLERDIDNLVKFANFLTRDAKLLRQTYNKVIFRLPLGDVRYSMLYGAIEKSKKRLNIIEYNIVLSSDDYYTDLLKNKQRDVGSVVFEAEPAEKGK